MLLAGKPDKTAMPRSRPAGPSRHESAHTRGAELPEHCRRHETIPRTGNRNSPKRPNHSAIGTPLALSNGSGDCNYSGQANKKLDGTADYKAGCGSRQVIDSRLVVRTRRASAGIASARSLERGRRALVLARSHAPPSRGSNRGAEESAIWRHSRRSASTRPAKRGQRTSGLRLSAPTTWSVVSPSSLREDQGQWLRTGIRTSAS